jgi:hypothetical protein
MSTPKARLAQSYRLGHTWDDLLYQLAEADDRSPALELIFLVRREAVQRGLLPPNNGGEHDRTFPADPSTAVGCRD